MLAFGPNCPLVMTSIADNPCLSLESKLTLILHSLLSMSSEPWRQILFPIYTPFCNVWIVNHVNLLPIETNIKIKILTILILLKSKFYMFKHKDSEKVYHGL